MPNRPQADSEAAEAVIGSGGIRNTFEVVPDAPVTKFTLSLKGGSRGLIQNSEDLCAKGKRHRGKK